MTKPLPNHVPTSVDLITLNKLKAQYESASQSHVFTFYDTLSPEEQSKFIQQLQDIDVHRVNRIYQNAIKATSSCNEQEEISPLPQESCATIINNPTDELKWRQIGLKAISENKVAVLLMAGGQGTRLGSNLPKGMYDIKLPSGSTLFQYQAGRIKKLAKLAKEAFENAEEVRIRWYVMTSGPTRLETEKYFEEKKFFGLRKEDVVFFEQGVLPALSEDGKILLSSTSSVAVAPDGNGGLYAALRRPLSPHSTTTILSDLRTHNVEYVHVYGVDNCLVRVADPVFIGYCISRNSSIGAKVVRKHLPTESVGVLAKKGETFTVVEYSEISKEKSESKQPDGSLSFWAGNIVNHFYTTTFLESIQQLENKMCFHIARKKIPTVDLKSGGNIIPTQPNGMKLELFVFDVFPFTKNLSVLEVDRKEEFSPLKNSPGSMTDSPETSRKDLLSQQKRWLEKIGVEIKDDFEIEILPECSYSGEGLEWVKDKIFEKTCVSVSRLKNFM
ncbi:hypothetical protein TREMEDRAFT_70294 [Tremella mesenterica DSM 1558]|uniref:uncharacterized protein n=1 Tax=Tremella mesenterica (strain ATCC 24925 / CBS 8224 / DSM 1558 / NBRC 9311 / NRRL Y-6157 / RJB 2259-6 / UBC 559-6) TaxID=578456 RepID=UPI00032CAAAD|nr:uncharacterized protein TREMEDRAFT_70294 [Tremella mesenterica DSM 1558]EIW66011.1 hypothetical protein TREMEDRAFT_70294 [Tremella mesenterica DSM 1558]